MAQLAKCGNHGHIIPRDRELLYRLHFVEGKTLTEIAAMFGVTNHKSVGNVLRKMGFPTPGQGYRAPKMLCIDCGRRPPKRLAHKLTKNGTGTRCEDCLKAYKARWIREELKRNPAALVSRRKQMKRWYEVGPINPKGEAQWILKAKHLLRTNRRLLKASPGVSLSLSEASAPEATSQR